MMGSMSTIFNHTVLNSWSFLRQCLKCSHQTQKKRTKRKQKKCEKGKKMITLWGDGNVNYLIKVIILHRIHVWHQVIHLTYGQFLTVKYILRSCLKKDDWTLGRHSPGCSAPGGPCRAVQKLKKKDDWKLPLQVQLQGQELMY